MQPHIYKIYINSVEVNPHYKTLTKKYEKESNQMFFREKLDGEIKLFGADFQLIKNSSIHTEHTFVVKKKVGDDYENYFTGTFNKTDCEIDLDKRECNLKINEKDMYSDIMNNYDNEYNLLDFAPALTSVNVSKRPILQVYVLEDNVLSNFLPNGETWEMEVDSTTSLNDLYEKHHFDLESRQIEIRIDTGSPYDGVYAGEGWSSAVLLSPTNPDYKIIGTVEYSGSEYTYYFHVYRASDYTLSNQLFTTGTQKSNSRYTVLTFKNTANENDTLIAETSMETVLGRILTGSSITSDGKVTTGKIDEGDFGYLNYYGYTYSISTSTGSAFSSVVVPASSEEPTSIGKADNGYYFVSPYIQNGRYYAVGKSTWAYSSRWIKINDVFSNTFNLYGSIYRDIKDCIHISEVIKVLLNKIAPGITHEATEEYSQFLYGENNPIYGEHFELFISQKTNIKRFIYDTPATKVPITLEKIMNMLAKCFRCYWFVEDNKLKIEHIYYFEHGRSYQEGTQSIGIDITQMYDNKNGRSFGFGQNMIKYDKNALPSRYEFKYMDESSIEFEGAAVKLTAAYLQQDKTESITTDGFSADLDMIISNTIAISDEGFALIAAKLVEDSEGSKYYSTFDYELELSGESGNTFTVKLQNGVLSWIYLFNFYCTNLPSTIAEYDGYPKKTIHVTGLVKCMSQSVKIPLEENPDLYKSVKTEIGEGMIEGVSTDITTNQTTIELLYEPE